MNKYAVTMQREDGEIVEADYSVRWNPEKVDSSEVARACAAEYCFRNGFYADGKPRNMVKHMGLSATLVAA